MKDLIVISLIIFVIYIIIKNKNKNTSKINSSNYKSHLQIIKNNP